MVWDTHTHTQKKPFKRTEISKKNIFSLFENKLNKFQFEIIQVVLYIFHLLLGSR
jgi:hypothetical protein